MPLQIHIKSGQHLWWGGPGRRLRSVTKAKRTAWQQGWTYSCCFSALGWSRNSIPMDPPFQCLPFWQIQSPWLVGNSHVFPICCQQLMLSQASPRAPPRLWPTWAVTAQSMLNDGANHPKYGWKMENMSQTTNHLTIAAFFWPYSSRQEEKYPCNLKGG